MLNRYLFPALAVLVLYACNSPRNNHSSPASIDSVQLTTYLSELASDRFLGRMPFSKGEEITVNYIRQQFEEAGLEPGNKGSYYQDVKLVMISSDGDPVLNIETLSGNLPLHFLDDFAAGTSRVEATTSIENSELVFVGYGIVAPEFGWNDHQGIDMKGKPQW